MRGDECARMRRIVYPIRRFPGSISSRKYLYREMPLQRYSAGRPLASRPATVPCEGNQSGGRHEPLAGRRRRGPITARSCARRRSRVSHAPPPVRQSAPFAQSWAERSGWLGLSWAQAAAEANGGQARPLNDRHSQLSAIHSPPSAPPSPLSTIHYRLSPPPSFLS
jgi:hypothetical protein